MDVLAPTGWDCASSFGADGSGGALWPPLARCSPLTGDLPAGSTDEAVVATQNGGCQRRDYQACPVLCRRPTCLAHEITLECQPTAGFRRPAADVTDPNWGTPATAGERPRTTSKPRDTFDTHATGAVDALLTKSNAG